MSAEQGGSQPDPYEMLGIDRDASREQVVRAWRRRARAEHPDVRPHDAAAPARFRALAQAYRVLADPDRRAAYDRASGRGPRPRAAATDNPPAQAAAMWTGDTGDHATAIPVVRVPDAPLRAGPVWIEPPYQSLAGVPPPDEDAVVAELLLRYLGRRWRAW